MAVPIISFTAYFETGKTTFLEKLLPCLKRMGLWTAVINHDGDGFQMDTPGHISPGECGHGCGGHCFRCPRFWQGWNPPWSWDSRGIPFPPPCPLGCCCAPPGASSEGISMVRTCVCPPPGPMPDAEHGGLQLPDGPACRERHRSSERLRKRVAALKPSNKNILDFLPYSW